MAVHKKLVLLACVALLSMQSGAWGQAQTPANPDSVLYVILAGLEGTPLSLDEAVQNASRNSTRLREAEASYLAARGTVRGEAGRFDPELFFNLDHSDREEPTASFFAGAPVLVNRQTSSHTGLRMDLPTGTELELALSSIRLETNSEFAFLNPQYDTFGSLSLRQPLLGGFSVSGQKDLVESERMLEAEKARYDQQILAASTEAELVYWDLYAAERDYAVQRVTRDYSESLVREAELRAQAGLVGPNQVANAKTFWAEQELLLIDMEELLDARSDVLASLMGVRPGAGEARFRTVEEPAVEFPTESEDALVSLARQNNLELQAAGREVEAARVLADAAKWESLPDVDLIGSLGGSGLAGRNQEVIFGTDTLRVDRGGDFGDALSQVARRTYPSWSLGVQVSFPLGLRSGLGEKDRLEALVLDAEQRRIGQSRTLEEQVRAVYREMANGKRRLEFAREGVDAAQEQVRIGIIEFRNGRLTAFELVRLGADFAVAQRRYSQALVRTAKAGAALRLLTSGKFLSTPTE